jgi:hypothetical protein
LPVKRSRESSVILSRSNVILSAAKDLLSPDSDPKLALASLP